MALWLESLDLVLERLSKAMAPVPMSRIQGMSGSGQQHGSVFWNAQAEELLRGLDPAKSLVEQLEKSLAHEFAPNWQDHSTQKELEAFDAELGDREKLAEVTGSGAHHVSWRKKEKETSMAFLFVIQNANSVSFTRDLQDFRL